MSDNLKKSRPEYHASTPFIGIHRPAVAKIDAVWNDRNGWEITLTPNQTVIDGSPELQRAWVDAMHLTEAKFRYDMIGEWPKDRPMPDEMKAFYKSAMRVRNPHCEPPDYRYTIRAYEGTNECKYELRLLLKILQELEFDKQVAGTDKHNNPFRLLGYTESYVFPHQLGIADYIKERETAQSMGR